MGWAVVVDNTPPVHVDDVSLGDVDEDFSERLVPVLASPLERAGEVVSRPQGDDGDAGAAVAAPAVHAELHFVHHGEDPAHRAVAATGCAEQRTFLKDQNCTWY